MAKKNKEYTQLLFSFNYPPMSGGISRLCEIIAHEISDKRGVVLTQYPEEPHYLHTRLPHYFVPKKRPWRELSSVFWLLTKVRKKDLIIADNWHPEGYLSILFGSRRNAILLHGAELLPGNGWFRQTIWKKWMCFTLQRASVVIANSEYTASLVRNTVPKANISVVPLGVDHNRFFPFANKNKIKNKFGVKDKFVIGSISRLHKYKGYQTVFRALKSLPDKVKKGVFYIIAGDGPDKNCLEKECKLLGIDDIVQFIGFVSETDLPLFYNALDLFVLCTEEQLEERRVEGFGLVFLEAQSCGVPVIGTRTGGIPDAVKENNGGFLINSNQYHELKNHIIKLATTPIFLKEIGKKARRRVLKEATLELYFKNLNQTIESI